MESKIFDYILKNKVFTMATSANDSPYCANCFYAFDDVNKILIFLSDADTRHIVEALQNDIIGGSIQNGVTDIDKLQGIQFIGEFIHPDPQTKTRFKQIYYERFPFAKEMPSPIWGIKLNWIKMTDNTLGFGKKLIWSSDES